jgi:catechol 2,3-dioxygenase-like lactoylglutathione lyase family enzyme
MTTERAITHGLFHVAIKTADLDRSVGFWTRIIGLRPVARPDFGYPGAWLGCPQPGGSAIVHLYAGGPVFGTAAAPRPAAIGAGAIDHVSLSCTGWVAMLARLRAARLDWREFLVPGTTLWQIFVHDPSGVQLELTFAGEAEAGPPPDMSPARVYRAGEDFFDAAAYPDAAAFADLPA